MLPTSAVTYDLYFFPSCLHGQVSSARFVHIIRAIKFYAKRVIYVYAFFPICIPLFV